MIFLREARRRGGGMIAARYVLMPLLLSSGHSAAAHCDLSGQQLTGAWRLAGHSGFFEEMEFAQRPDARVFNSWLHQRPDMVDVAWSLQHCELTVQPRDGSDALRFDAALVDGRLALRERGGAEWARYKRVPESR